MAITFFIAYILLVLTIFQGKSVTEAWRVAVGSVILSLSLFVTLFVPYSSVARRASMLGKLTCCLEFWKFFFLMDIYKQCTQLKGVDNCAD